MHASTSQMFSSMQMNNWRSCLWFFSSLAANIDKMRLVDSVEAPSVCYIFLALLFLPHTDCAVQITPKHQGKTVKASVGSSVNFTWSFTGNVGRINWGLKQAGANLIDFGNILVTIAKDGTSSSSLAPAAYSGRVSGSRSGDSSSGQVIFTLSQMTLNDGNLDYGCKIEALNNPFDLGDFDYLHLDVEGPPIITHISSNQTVNEGDKVKLNCTADGNPSPTSINWKKLSDNSVVTFPLTVSKQDSGGYRCTADNGIGSPISRDVFIIVQYKPTGVTISTSVTQNTVKQGQNVTLTCNVADAFPPVSEYKFYLNDSLSRVTNVNKYTIFGVKRSQHYGEYKCEAHTAAGDEQSTGVILNVNVPAKIQSKIANVTVNEQDSIDLKCEVSGHPAPSVTWTKDGAPVQSVVAGVIHIGKSKRDDSGAYVCKADNNVGQADQMRVFVTVNYAATIKSISSSVSKSWIGQRVRLKCVSDGVPTPTLSWYKPEGTKFNPVKANENTVDVTMNSDQDFGLYNCTADNGFDPASLTVRVQQIKAPGSPSITTTADDIQATSLTVKWNAPADNGGSPITAYRVVILQGGKVIKNENVNTSVKEKFIGGLDKNTSYTVKVYSRNFVFEGDAAQKIIKTNYEVSLGKCPALKVRRLVKTSPNSCVTSQVEVNTNCSFSCPQGYQLQGPSYKQCRSGGQWTNSAKTVSCIAPGVNVQCNSENMTITIPKSLLRGMDREHLRLLDTTCKATETSPHFSLTTPLTGCNTTSRHTPTAIVYSNAVLEIPVAAEDVVTRVREIEIQFSCFYSKYGVVSSVGWKPSDRKLVFSDEGHGNFTFSLNMFPDKRFVSPYMKDDFPVAVVLRKLLFFEVSVKSDDKQLSIRADRCYATPTQDLTSALKYEFLKKGCPNDVTVKYLSAPSVNVQRFSLEAFKFIADHPFVFVHCHVIVCNATDPGSKCAKSCSSSGRGRRKVAAHTNEVYSLVQGPLYLARKKRGEKHEIGQDKSGSSPTITMALFVICVACLAGTALMAM